MDKYAVNTALNMIDELEAAIFSLEQLPERGTTPVIIYRVLKIKKEVHIVTVRYTPSSF